MIANLIPDFGAQVVKWLAVVGGAAVGGVLFGVFVLLAGRLLRRKRVPRLVLNGGRLLGAAVFGVVVYWLVFGLGGSGFGLGGGSGFGLGGQGSNGGTTQPGTSPTTQPRTATAPASERSQILSIEMLGGDRYKGKDRFYLVEGVAEPQTLDEVRQLIQRREGQLKELEIVIRQKGSVAEGHAAVQQLKQLADDHKLTVQVRKPADDKP
jgi:hypothetical protein